MTDPRRSLNFACARGFKAGSENSARAAFRIFHLGSDASGGGYWPKPLPAELTALRARTWEAGLVFGLDPVRRFDEKGVRRRAKSAWQAAGLTPITLHECRHTFASIMIAAGVDAKSIAEYMGHASVATTYDLYGHLMPGSEAEAASRIDRYLGRSADDG